MPLFARRKVLINLYGSTLSLAIHQGDRLLASQNITCDATEVEEGRIKSPSAVIGKITEFLASNGLRRCPALINAPFFALCPPHRLPFTVLQLLLAIGRTPLRLQRVVALDVPTLASLPPREQQARIASTYDYLQPFLGGNANPWPWLLATACLAGLTGIFSYSYKLYPSKNSLSISGSAPACPPPPRRTAASLKHNASLLSILSESIPDGVVLDRFVSQKKPHLQSPHRKPQASCHLDGRAIDATKIVTFCERIAKAAPHYNFHLSSATQLSRQEIASTGKEEEPYCYRFTIDLT